jgi:hypothetical protein
LLVDGQTFIAERIGCWRYRIPEQLARRDREARHGRIAEAAHLQQVDEYIYRDQPDRDVLKGDRFQMVIVTQRNEQGLPAEFEEGD